MTDTYGPERDTVQDAALPALRKSEVYNAARDLAKEADIPEHLVMALANRIIKILNNGAWRPGLNLCCICARLLLDGRTCEAHGRLDVVTVLVAYPPLERNR